MELGDRGDSFLNYVFPASNCDSKFTMDIMKHKFEL